MFRKGCAAFAVALALITLAPQLGSAQESSSDIGIGIRVGGYGFREIANDESTRWTDCRMDGLGLFNTYELGGGFFTEAGLDYYQAIGRVVDEEGMDRISVSAIGAIGFRMFPWFVISPYVQLGGGVEYSKVTWTGFETENNGFHPVGFLGIGSDVNIGDHVRLGMNIRALMMAGFPPPEHGPAHQHGGVHFHSPSDAEAAAAGQVQFFFRYQI